jgi:hypothetical protein
MLDKQSREEFEAVGTEIVGALQRIIESGYLSPLARQMVVKLKGVINREIDSKLQECRA